MITRARIQNFRCLVDVDLTFEPLTILVGPNASGKSALIAALDPRSGLVGDNAFRGAGYAFVDIAWDGGKLEGRINRSYALNHLHLDIEKLRLANQTEEAAFLSSDESNFANVFGTLTRKQQDEVADTFTTLVPMYSDVADRPLNRGQHRLVFQDRWQPSLWYEPHQVSDGSMLLLAFLTLQYQATPVDIIAIEEPERAMHPYLLGELIKFAAKPRHRKAGTEGHPSHSGYPLG